MPVNIPQTANDSAGCPIAAFVQNRATLQTRAVADARRLVAASTELLRRLEAGHQFNGPTALEAELRVAHAAASVARQDTFEEWLAYCGEQE